MKQNERCRIVGVTGRIATGKSTLASVFSIYGYEVIDADAIYGELFRNSAAMQKELLGFFGTLDRSVILDEITRNSRSYEKLNEITHPYVEKEIIYKVGGSSEKRFVLDVPVPVRNGFIDLCDYILTTDCCPETQASRLMERNGITREEAFRRMAMQLERCEYIGLADCIVNTENMRKEDMVKIVSCLVCNKED